MDKVKQILIEARDLIANVGWTQGVFHRDEDGEDTGISKKPPVCYCSTGALGASPSYINMDAGERSLLWRKVIIPHLAMFLPPPYTNIVVYNDTEGRTKEEVLAVFDKAIEAL